MTNSNDRIVFYDGDCGFCNRTVDFVLKYDKTKSIRFARIQSEFASRLFREHSFEEADFSTFYFLEKDVLYKKSTAALKLLKYFSFPLSLLRFFWIVPRFIRDAIYDAIAKRRNRLSNGYCVMPEKGNMTRFIG